VHRTCRRLAQQRIAGLASVPAARDDTDLGATVRIVHGREIVAQGSSDLTSVSRQFAAWVLSRQHASSQTPQSTTA
jgi:hypothetical protein